MCMKSASGESLKINVPLPEWAISHPAWIRLESEISWYDHKSTSCQSRYKCLKFAQMSLAVAIPVFGALSWDYSRIMTSISGALIAVLEGVQHMNQYSTLWISYRATTERLKHEKFLFLSGAGSYKHRENEERLILLSERTEELVSTEQKNWFSESNRGATGKKDRS